MTAIVLKSFLCTTSWQELRFLKYQVHCKQVISNTYDFLISYIDIYDKAAWNICWSGKNGFMLTDNKSPNVTTFSCSCWIIQKVKKQ